MCMKTTSIITQAATSSASAKERLLLAAEQGRLHQVQALLDEKRCKVNDEDEVSTSRSSKLVLLSVVCCLICACLCTSVHLYRWLHLCVSLVYLCGVCTA